MATNRRVISIAYPAGQDLSSHQFRIMQMSSDGQIDPLADGNSPPLGVLLNKPSAAGEGAEVAVDGADVKIEAGAAMDEGALVVPVTGGRGSTIGGTATGTTWVVGLVTQSASGSGAFAGVLIRPHFHVRA